MKQIRQRKRFRPEEWTRFAIAVLGGGSKVVPRLDYIRRAVECSGHTKPERYEHIHQIPGLKKATDFLVEQGLVARVEIEEGGYGYQRTDKAIPVELVSAASVEAVKKSRKGRASGMQVVRRRRSRQLNSSLAGVLDVVMRLCAVLKRQGKKRQKAIAQAAEQMKRIEARLARCEEEMEKLHVGIRTSSDGAGGAYFERAQRRVLALLDQIELEKA